MLRSVASVTNSLEVTGWAPTELVEDFVFCVSGVVKVAVKQNVFLVYSKIPKFELLLIKIGDFTSV